MPTLDVILTQTQTPADAEAGRLPRPGQQPGRRRARQEPRARATASPASPPQPEPGVAPQPLRAQSPAPQPPPEARVITSAAQRRAHDAAARHAAARSKRRCRAAAQKIERDMEMARLAAEIHLRSRALRQAPEAQVRLGQHQGIRVRRLPARLGRPRRARRQPQLPRRSAPPPPRRAAGDQRGDPPRRHGRDAPTSSSPAASRCSTPPRCASCELAEPFAPLPKTAENVDILHVTRTWQFLPGGELIDR